MQVLNYKKMSMLQDFVLRGEQIIEDNCERNWLPVPNDYNHEQRCHGTQDSYRSFDRIG